MPASLWPSVPSQQPTPTGDFPNIPLLVSGAPSEWPTLSGPARRVSVCSRPSYLQEWSRTKLSSSGADDTPLEARARHHSRLIGNHFWGLHVTRLWQPQGDYAIGFSYRDLFTNYPDAVPMPVLGPSLLFCGKPACWVRGSNPQDKVNPPSPSPTCWTGPPRVQSLGDCAITGSLKSPTCICVQSHIQRV